MYQVTAKANVVVAANLHEQEKGKAKGKNRAQGRLTMLTEEIRILWQKEGNE